MPSTTSAASTSCPRAKPSDSCRRGRRWKSAPCAKASRQVFHDAAKAQRLRARAAILNLQNALNDLLVHMRLGAKVHRRKPSDGAETIELSYHRITRSARIVFQR